MEVYYDPNDKPEKVSDRDNVIAIIILLIICACVIFTGAHLATYLYNLIF